MALKTDYKDDVFTGNRKYNQITNSDGTISLLDVTEYSQEGSVITAEILNSICGAVNEFYPENITEGDCDNLYVVGQTKLYYFGSSNSSSVANAPCTANFWLLSIASDAYNCVQIVFSRTSNDVIHVRHLTSGGWLKWNSFYSMEYDSSTKTLNILM